MLFFSAEPYIWGDIYKSWDEFAATKLLRKLLRLGCFWCSESRRKLRKSGVSEVGSTPVVVADDLSGTRLECLTRLGYGEDQIVRVPAGQIA